jgi:hypothetical protein
MTPPAITAHVIPANDAMEHVPTAQCACHPLIEPDGIAIHHAADLREKWERQKLTTSKGWLVISA